MIQRKKTLEVNVWGIKIWWDNSIVIQSMTNTPTADIDATVTQIKELADAGSELVRITVDTEASAQAVPEIIKRLRDMGIQTPIIWDFHFNWHILLEKYPEMAQSLAKYRINPGNVGTGDKHDENFRQFISFAVKYDKPIRIGINWWSLDKELLAHNMEENSKTSSPKSDKEVFVDSMVQSCLLSIKKAEEIWLSRNKIVLSVKISDVQEVISATEKLSKETDCPLHLWLTEAGWSTKWLVSSSAALWILLQQWIWDTIRISLTPSPGEKRSLEVQACKYLLQTMWFRNFQPLITSCPWCGRTSSDAFQTLAQQVNDEINIRLPEWKKQYPGFEKTKIAVMWCIVNGVGEASNADIWIFFPWNMEDPSIPVYVKWKMYKILKWDDIFDQFMEIIEMYFQGKI